MNRSLRTYIYAISSLFWLGLFAALMTGALGSLHPTQLAPLLGLAIAVEAIGVRKQDNTIGFSAVAHLAAAVLFGPVAAASIAAVAVVLVDGIRSRRTHFILLNSAMFGTAAWTAGLAYEATGGTVGTVVPSNVLPLVAMVATRLIVNEAIFSGAVSMMHASFRRALRDNLRDSFGQSIGEGCLGVLLAYGYNSERWAMLPFLVPLLAALYKAQASYERLKSETKDALDALAAVVDERDPLTTQHSERVAALVDRFTGAIGLPDRESRRLVDAARFHDLGKVAIDVATLSKEGRLTDQEMRAIRSHPRLSARLLSPFGFAEQISLYAELHHERYDGRGYYAVSQSEIPVEAHVLIAADSYDAMTSKRAYRPALTPQEAVAELRDKAGSQFHPLVATAFAAMIEGHDPNEAMGRSQVSVLRDEFSKMTTVPWPDVSGLASPGAVTVTLAALALVAFGVPGLPPWPALVLASGAVLASAWALIAGVSERRRTAAALAVIADGGSPEAALATAGLPCWAVWLRFQPQLFEYEALPGAAIGGEQLRELCTRALRPGVRGCSGRLASGTWIAITGGDDPLRLAVGSERPLSRSESQLVRVVADHLRAEVAEEPPPDPLRLVGDQRRTSGPWQPAVIVVELRVFENVRVVAGQLSAERVVSEARVRLDALLREGDRLGLLSEDRFGIVIGVTERSQVEAVCRRIQDALADLPVPGRADRVEAVIRTPSQGETASDRELSQLVASYTYGSRKAG
ncbi:MAG TPA: HD domain-containing phosphohydrolase [Gaiellales bacterium]|nr:HD domain-containing phosphohydrolase [Gaiellales bacterium]